MNIWNNILKFNCTYQQNGEIKDNYNWSGYMKREECPFDKNTDRGIVSSIEGIIIDEQVKEILITELYPYKKYKQKYIDKRYLYGETGIHHPEGTLKFVIFPLNHQPIDYEFMYDGEDNCLYGVWYFVNKELKNLKYGGFARLNIEQEIDINEDYVEKEIEDCEAYYQHYDVINDLMKSKMPNIQQHDESNNQRFIDAKNYFREYDKINDGKHKTKSIQYKMK